jgi:hypothetical protein
MAACCTCFGPPRPSRPGGSDRASDTESLTANKEIFGPAACRRLSLSELPRPSAAALSAASSGSAAGGCGDSSGLAARAGSRGSGFSVTAAAASSTAGVAGSRPPSFQAEGSFEFNPLRRVSLPMQGQAPRPADELRRSSMQFVPAAARSSSGGLGAAIAAR